MPWLLGLPRHQQPCYWPSSPGMFGMHFEHNYCFGLLEPKVFISQSKWKNRFNISASIGITILGYFCTCRLVFPLLVMIETYLLADRPCLIWKNDVNGDHFINLHTISLNIAWSEVIFLTGKDEIVISVNFVCWVYFIGHLCQICILPILIVSLGAYRKSNF